MSPLVGKGATAVFDDREDLDTEDSTQLISNPKFGDYEIYGSYNNNYSGLPPAVLVKENIYCWKNQNSFLVKYTVINRETSPMNEIFGLELIPELEGAYAGTDTVTFNNQTKIFGDRKTEAVGFKLLSGEINSLNVFMYYSGYNTDSSFWDWLSNGSMTTQFIIDPATPNVDDPVLIPSFYPKTIPVGDSVTYYVAVGYGLTNAKMLANMQLAQLKYNQLVSVKSDLNGIPSGYVIGQNYPNPFNPSTKIEYQVPTSGLVTLKVYNVLGKEVATLVNAQRSAGKYVVDFNARGLTSGIYFYTIKSGSFNETRKMILLK
jgi:hypothetical protein